MSDPVVKDSFLRGLPFFSQKVVNRPPCSQLFWERRANQARFRAEVLRPNNLGSPSPEPPPLFLAAL